LRLDSAPGNFLYETLVLVLLGDMKGTDVFEFRSAEAN